jgi:two-component system, NtrC family, nitrogen regulation sensor histidine kinase NtrY
MSGPRAFPRLKYETRLTLLSLAGGLPAVVAALALVWIGPFDLRVQCALTAVVVGMWWALALIVRARVVRPLRTLSNLLATLREEDFSFRARGGRPDDALGEAMREANSLSETLREQRLGALEATALLRTVMSEIDVAIFTFDSGDRLRLVNRAGERLLGRPAERLLGCRAGEIGLAECLEEGPARALPKAFPGAVGRWSVRSSAFRQRGLPHRLLVVQDLTRTLREEELEAWKRLVRVLGHELNNSLAPIKSIAGSLKTLLGREVPPPDWKEDAERGLTVIAGRAEALSRFLEAYSRLAKLPPPKRRPVDVGAWVRRVATLERRLAVRVAEGDALTMEGDGDQLDQLLINLVRNAVDAALATGGGVEVGWRKAGSHIEVLVHDEGPGLANTANLFVPFFTTKRGGSGIGLVLSRQIAEAHGGTLTLENRQPGPGCVARLQLPG